MPAVRPSHFCPLALGLLLGLLTTACATSVPPAPTHTVYHLGPTTDATPPADQLTPLLLLSGGGGDVDAAWRRFLAAAGGGDILILRAAGADGYHDYLFKELGGIHSVTTIVFHDRAAATDPAVLARLARAEGIFLAGGDQSRYLRYWADTPVAAALSAHHAAGKPLGGTSAGLAVLGEFIFTADFDPRTAGGELTTAVATANPSDPRITLGPRLIDLPALRGIITDSHFTGRDRLGRLLVFLDHLRPATPAIIGLGIDERTALVIAPDGTATVHATTTGTLTLAASPTRQKVLPPNTTFNFPTTLQSLR